MTAPVHARPDAPTLLVEALRADGPLLVLTGAGMSAESGIATFRDAQTGLWSRFDPYALASPEGWARDRELVWAWYEWRRAAVAKAQPHAGHRALAELQRHRPTSIVTQNVDDLHERAGATGVVHLHGSLFAPRCESCGSPGALPDPPAEPLARIPPPTCASCGRHVRPGVVWFGEMLRDADLRAADRLVRGCSTVLVVGTSGLVHPAAGLPTQAARLGKTVIEINPEPTALSDEAHLRWRATAATALPTLLDALR